MCVCVCVYVYVCVLLFVYFRDRMFSILLLSGDVELNPEPQPINSTVNLLLHSELLKKLCNYHNNQ